VTGRKGPAIAAGFVAIASLAACSASARQASPANHPATIAIRQAACAPGWRAPKSGRSLLTVDNQTQGVVSVDLLGADQATMYGEIENLGPGTTATMDVILPPGRYSIECESTAGSSSFSEVQTVSGPPVTGARPYVPVDFSQIQLATLHYRSELTSGLQQLARDTDVLDGAVHAGNLSLAKRLWLLAHLDYARLGAAYDTFGDFGDQIDGRPNGLPEGVSDPNFQGFLRLEYGLWHDQPVPVLGVVASHLDSAVHGLVKQFPQMQTPANDLSLRTHEILENTLQFELTGEEDEGSHTTLATALANVQGTQLALGAIAPLLAQHEPQLLASSTSGLRQLGARLATFDRGGAWTPLDELSQPQREQLDGDMSSLLEQLSVIPDLLELPVQPATADS
jgi:iron uptake system EfeUOB component EfeO/EfeM